MQQNLLLYRWCALLSLFFEPTNAARPPKPISSAELSLINLNASDTARHNTTHPYIISAGPPLDSARFLKGYH